MRTRTINRTMDIQYLGDSVHSVMYSGDSVVKITARRYAQVPLAFNQLETVLTRLPLRAGYQATLPLYSEGDDSVEVDTVSVVGVIAGDRPRWRVRFADPAVVVMYMIDTLTHRLYGVETGFNRKMPGRRGFMIPDSTDSR